MRWIGLTGGIASGKSTVAKFIEKRGFPVIDADKIAHQVIEPGADAYVKVLKEFGSGILAPDQSIDRKKLGQLVFGNASKLRALEDIIHPAVKAETANKRKKLAASGVSVAFYDVPLLYEKNLEAEFDGVLLVTCSEQLQRSRLKSRNSLSDEEIAKRLAAQIPLVEKEKRATWVIRNEGSLADLEKIVDDVVAVVTKKS